MQTPPPYRPAYGPKKNHTLTYALLGVSGLCLLLCGVSGYFGFQFVSGAINNITPLIGCTMDLQDSRDALVKYAEAKGKFPEAATWQQDVKSYYLELRENSDKEIDAKDSPFKIERMDPEGAWGCTFKSEGKTIKTGFAFNKDLAGKKFSEVTSPTTTPLIFEVPTVAMNQTLPYKAPTEPAQPKIMGESRTWMKANVMGKVDSTINSNGSKKSISIN